MILKKTNILFIFLILVLKIDNFFLDLIFSSFKKWHFPPSSRVLYFFEFLFFSCPVNFLTLSPFLGFQCFNSKESGRQPIFSVSPLSSSSLLWIQSNDQVITMNHLSATSLPCEGKFINFVCFSFGFIQNLGIRKTTNEGWQRMKPNLSTLTMVHPDSKPTCGFSFKKTQLFFFNDERNRYRIKNEREQWREGERLGWRR